MAVIECLSLKDKIEWLKTRENFEVRKYLEEQTNHVKIDYYGEYPSILELMDSQTKTPLCIYSRLCLPAQKDNSDNGLLRYNAPQQP